MKFSFKDIVDDKVYNRTRVMFVVGRYSYFLNLVADELKMRCLPKDRLELDDNTKKLFGFDDTESSEATNVVDFSTFMSVYQTRNINGLWYCRVDLSLLTKVQKEWLFKYIKDPSDNGVLVITSQKFKEYGAFAKSNIINNSQKVHFIDISWPTKKILYNLVEGLLEKRGCSAKAESIWLFILRLGSDYDSYESVIDSICENYTSVNYSNRNTILSDMASKNDADNTEADSEEESELYEIGPSEFKEKLKFIQNFDLEQFLDLLLTPLANDNTTGKKIYKMLYYLIYLESPSRLVQKLLREIDMAIEFRELINSGYIPIRIHYSFNEVKRLIGDKSKLTEMSEYRFRNKAQLASRTSLRDWEYMRLILKRANLRSDESCEKALYSLTVRTVLNESRLDNAIGVDNILDRGLDRLNTVDYIDRTSIRMEE